MLKCTRLDGGSVWLNAMIQNSEQSIYFMAYARKWDWVSRPEYRRKPTIGEGFFGEINKMHSHVIPSPMDRSWRARSGLGRTNVETAPNTSADILAGRNVCTDHLPLSPLPSCHPVHYSPIAYNYVIKLVGPECAHERPSDSSRPLVPRASDRLGHFSFALCQLFEVCRLVVMRSHCWLNPVSACECVTTVSEIVNGPSSNQVGLISMICLM